MVWRNRSTARWIVPSMAALRPSSISKDTFHCSPLSGFTNFLVGLPKRCIAASDAKTQHIYSAEAEGNHTGLLPSVERNLVLRLEASSASSGLAKDHTHFKVQNVSDVNSGVDLFGEMKLRFLSFKKHKYLGEREHFRTLTEAQAPKTQGYAPLTS